MARWTLYVAGEALDEARWKFGLANIDAELIRDDVRSAILDGRISKDSPYGTGFRLKGKRAYAWTPNRMRVYLVTWSRKTGKIAVRHAFHGSATPLEAGVAA